MSTTPFLHRGLTWITAGYLLLLPTVAGKRIREILWLAGAALGIAVLVNLASRRERLPPLPGKAVPVSILAWMLWATLSLAWTDRPAFTLNELRNEVLNNVVLIGIIYYVADSDRAMRVLLCAVLGGFALHAGAMLAWPPFSGDGDPFRWHFGVVWAATWLTLSAPLLLLPMLPSPPGFGGGRLAAFATAVLLALLVAAAVVTENRMMWIAFAVEAVALLALATQRSAAGAPRFSRRLIASSLLGALVLCAGFLWALNERVPTGLSGSDNIANVLQKDPRIGLWKQSLESIASRPWLGHGFGKGITDEAMVRDLGDPLLWHPHNVFLSAWQQTGLVGMLALAAVFATMAWRFFRFARSRDTALAVTGAIGLAVVLGFLVKNLTDDFMVRSSAKEFWVYTTLLLGYGARRSASLTRGAPAACGEATPTRPST